MTNYEHVKNKRHRNKATLVAEAGGRCEKCGYDKSMRALSFHHRDPSTKLFSISACLNRALDALRREAAKCVLLCANCHMELEDTLSASIPSP